MNKFFVFLVIFGWIFSLDVSFAQRTCLTDEIQHQKHKLHFAGGDIFEGELQKRIEILRQRENNKGSGEPNLARITESTYSIPVIVHIVHNGEAIGEGTNISAAQVYGQIEVLNEDFNNLNPDLENTLDVFKDAIANPSIEFVLATIDENGNPLEEPGINRIKGCQSQWIRSTFDTFMKPISIWNPDKYFNIWVAKLSGGGFGYAQFPVNTNLGGIEDEKDIAETDGIVVNYINFGSIAKTPNIPQLLEGAPLNRGRTATHEAGHYFGVLHTWGQAESCSVDDFCEDTPRTERPHRDCDYEALSECGDNPLKMIQNFMDYTEDACMTLFTKDQVARMHAVMEISPRRKSLLTSDVAKPLGDNVFALFNTNQTRILKGGAISFEDASFESGNATIASYEWTFEGGSPNTSSLPNPEVLYAQAGSFEATLQVTSSDGKQSQKTIQIEVLDEINAVVSTKKDFEDASFLSGGWQLLIGNRDWRLSGNGSFGQSNASALASNFTINGCDGDMSLISPYVAVGTNKIFEISFDYAYALRESRLTDSLEVSYSIDGGESFVSLWKRGGKQLSTAANTNSLFSPDNEDWKDEILYLEVDDNVRVVQVKFRNIGAGNNQLYLDNLFVGQANNLEAPIVRFDVNYPLILTTEEAKFYSKSEFGVNFDWEIVGSEVIVSEEESPRIRFSNAGVYDVSLTVSNPVGSRSASESNAIEVLKGTRLSNTEESNLQIAKDNGNPISGHNSEQDQAIAEYFDISRNYEKLHAIDIHFAEALINNPLANFSLVLWSVGQNGEPDSEIKRISIPYSLIERDVNERRQFTRIVFEDALDAPTQFFVGIELEYGSSNELVLFTERKQSGSGWKRKQSGEWVSYESEGQAYSHAISLILTPDEILSTDNEPIASLINLFPNPNDGNFKLEVNALEVEKIEVYNAIGQKVHQSQHNSREPISLSLSLDRGLYLARIQTDKGVVVKRLVVK